jgi:hypothetical protein
MKCGEKKEDRKSRDRILHQGTCFRLGRWPIAVFLLEEAQLVQGFVEALRRHCKGRAGFGRVCRGPPAPAPRVPGGDRNPGYSRCRGPQGSPAIAHPAFRNLLLLSPCHIVWQIVGIAPNGKSSAPVTELKSKTHWTPPYTLCYVSLPENRRII